MSIAAYITPPLVHAAFNPTKVAYSKASTDADVSAALTLTIGGVEGNVEMNIERNFIGNLATFYIERILQKSFKEAKVDLMGTHVVFDTMLATKYQLKGMSPASTAVYTRVALNAVVQQGESSDFSKHAGKFLTKARYLQKFEGYPLNVAALRFDGITYLMYNDYLVSNIAIEELHFVINIPDNISQVAISEKTTLNDPLLRANDGELITANDGTVIELFAATTNEEFSVMQVVRSCTPDSPFYVKWINASGGYDYFMFRRRQKVKHELKNVQVSVPFTGSSENVYNEEVYGYEVDSSVTAGAENVNKFEFEVLRGLLTSPRMWWFNEEVRKWIRIYIGKGSTQEDTWQTMHSVEFEFAMPSQNVQI
jgi:hypothetical protein